MLRETAFLTAGFRPFFFGATVLALLAMIQWLGVYLVQLPFSTPGMSMMQWHAHEMIYGYALAVIAGFLLTAARNWTGEETANGTALGMLFTLWALARLLMLPGTLLLPAAIADLAFMAVLGFAVARPILKVRQRRQAPVLLLLALLIISNAVFYLGAAGQLSDGGRLGIFSGLYGVLGMVMLMGRRVIPFFTERGVGHSVEMKNARWNDIATFVSFPGFLLSELIYPQHSAGALLAGLLFVLNSLRLLGWHTPRIWRKPLLWGLFASFMMINLGFLLRALTPMLIHSPLIPVHAFAVGGIGTITISMMARVTLGHTGRNVHQAPQIFTVLLTCMLLTAVLRVFMPLLDPSRHTTWIAASGILWIVTFGLFAGVFIPMLLRSRVDTKPG